MNPGQMIQENDYWLYRDSYNQIWKITRDNDPHLPLRISIHEKLNGPIGHLEKLLRKSN